MDAKQQPPRRLGLVRQRRNMQACGLCGLISKMTKTHVPPQGAGNRHEVGRRHFMMADGVARLTRPSDGGLYVYGLCDPCNGLQSRYDLAYQQLAAAVSGLWVREDRLVLNGPLPLPDAQVRPGAIVRSVLIGMFGVSPHLHAEFPDLALQLMHRESSLSMPPRVRVRLALARGLRARITGATAGYVFRAGAPRDRSVGSIGIVNLGQIYFPPLAWQLAPPAESVFLLGAPRSLLDHQGWADVTDWTQYDPDVEYSLAGLRPTLPVVAHPRHDPLLSERWVELFSDEVTEFVECDKVPDAVLDDLRGTAL